MVNLQVSEAPSDFVAQAAREILAAATAHDGQSPVSDQAFLAVTQGKRTLALFSEAETAVAFGIVGEGEVDLVVAPAARGRGIGTAALAELVARSDATGGGLLAWAHGTNPAAEALLARAGFTPQRSLYRMELDPRELRSAHTAPPAVPLPAGFTLRNFDAGRDAAAWVAVNAAAFATHPEQGRITVDDFALMRQEPWFNAADLFLLETPSALAGYTWVKTVRGGEASAGEGKTADAAADQGAAGQLAAELYAIGIDPAFSGQGLGKALLEVTLARMAELRPTQVELYVDGENERAVGMYERAGFTIASRSRQFARG